jgi:hypothetical protein
MDPPRRSPFASRAGGVSAGAEVRRGDRRCREYSPLRNLRIATHVYPDGRSGETWKRATLGRALDRGGIVIKKVFVALVAVAAVSSLWVSPAVARQRERFQSTGLDAFWHSERRIDRDHYLQITWYAGAYVSQQGDRTRFFSDLYKDVDRCERREGRDRCRNHAFLVGYRKSLGVGESLEVDRRLTSGSLHLTYPMKERVDREWVRTGQQITVDATLAGSGDLYRSEYSESSWDGHCLVFSYESSYQRREAVATGTLSGDVVLDLGDTRDSGLSRSKGSIVENDCE